MHSQKTDKQDYLRELANKMTSSDILVDTVSSEMSAFELRCTTLVAQVAVLVIIVYQGWGGGSVKFTFFSSVSTKCGL